jgi:hypothetical protein
MLVGDVAWLVKYFPMFQLTFMAVRDGDCDKSPPFSAKSAIPIRPRICRNALSLQFLPSTNCLSCDRI